MTRFYRFPDEQSALEVLGIDIDGTLTIPVDARLDDGRYIAIDIINGNGVIIRRIGGTDEEPINETLDGFHVNITGSDMPEIAGYEIYPSDPVCVFSKDGNT